MAGTDFDLVVIGAGSGGVRAGRIAADLGAKVAVAESHALGGTCVNAGCVPKKLLYYAAERRRALADAAGFGLHVGAPDVRWDELIASKDREVAYLNAIYGRLLATSGATVLRGHASLRDPHTVEVDGRAVTTRYVLIATGGQPFVPALPGSEHGLTSDDVLRMTSLPRRVVIVGAGVIALELAGVFHAFGVEVTLAYRGREVLNGYDDDVRAHLGAQLAKQGVHLRPGANVARVERTEAGLRVHELDGHALECDALVFATGRTPRTGGIGLEELGVVLDHRGAVVVDDQGRSSVPNVFAVGDCLGGPALTPLAIAQGQAVAHTLFGTQIRSIHPALLPHAVFSHPAVATVGLTESEARARHAAVDVYVGTYRPLEHALSGRDERAMVKLCVDAQSDRVLGCHMVAHEAPEVIQGFAVAMQRGATKADFDATLGIHPTAGEELVTLRNPRRA